MLVVVAGENWFFTNLCTRLVLPTPCAPRTTIFASRDWVIVSVGLDALGMWGSWSFVVCRGLDVG